MFALAASGSAVSEASIASGVATSPSSRSLTATLGEATASLSATFFGSAGSNICCAVSVRAIVASETFTGDAIAVPTFSDTSASASTAPFRGSVAFADTSSAARSTD